LDSRPPSLPLKDYVYKEARYTALANSNPEAAKVLLERGQAEVTAAWRHYEQLAAMQFSKE
jgi:pyruvate-ferredoxin/flavodoxin oxidoreductase